MRGERFLMAGGVLSFVVAVLHVGIIIAGPPAYRYFGAGEDMATMAESSLLLSIAVTLPIAVVFAVFGLYAFSGAGVIRRLPFLAAALAAIGGIYTLRGLIVIPQAFLLLGSAPSVYPRELVFSLVSLFIGIVYLVGTVACREKLKAGRPAAQKP